MTLFKSAFLEIQGSTNATFEFSLNLSPTSTLEKSYLMGEQGQYLREIFNQAPGTGSFDASRRTGYWLDGGAGTWGVSVSFQTGLEDVQWGDGSGGTGPSNVTATDASGAEVKPLSRLQVLQNWLARSKSDSGGDTRLHIGEWTDGTVGGVSAGAFGEPMYVAVQDTNFSMPEPNDQGPSSFDGSINFAHVSRWGGYDAPDWFDDAVGAVVDAASAIPDA